MCICTLNVGDMNNPGYDQCHCLAMRRGTRSMSRLYDAHLEPSGLSISQFSLLSVIAQTPDVRSADLGMIMVMERSTLVRNIAPLRDGRLIEVTRRKGERSHGYVLTDSGRARLAAARPLWLAAQAAFEREFGTERSARLRMDNLEVGKLVAPPI